MNSETIISAINEQVSKAFIGSEKPIELLTIALLSEAHVLIEDIPGVGKTTLAKAFARATGLEFSRLQFTPDMLPGDVLGANIWSPTEQSFIFHPGPVHSQCILADELNRGATRTQAAFLEAMQEYQVTVDGRSYQLPRPFIVLATQNPLEYSGTFQLPEAELDRFALSFTLGYPQADKEQQMLARYRGATRNNQPITEIKTVLGSEQIIELQEGACQVEVSPGIEKYLLSLATATRTDNSLRYGISPRCLLQLTRLCQSRAMLQGRNMVLPEDVQALWFPCLGHRLSLTGDAQMSGINLSTRLSEIYESVRFTK